MSAPVQKAARHVPFQFGILNCVLGLFGIIFSSVAMSLPTGIFKNEFGYNFVGTGEGVWCGIFLISTGLVGILTKVKSTASSCMYIVSGVLGILTSLINLVGFGICGLLIVVYSYYLGNATFVGLYTVIATVCFTGVSSSIVQAAFSFRVRSCTMKSEITRFTKDGQECAVTVKSTSAPNASRSTQSNDSAIFRIGITEVVLGTVVFSLDVAIVSFLVSGMREGLDLNWVALGVPGTGIWGGIFVCLSGVSGIVHKSKPELATLNINMLLSLLAASMSVVSIAIHGGGAVTLGIVMVILHACTSIISLATLIVCLVHSALCCKSVCVIADDTVALPDATVCA